MINMLSVQTLPNGAPFELVDQASDEKKLALMGQRVPGIYVFSRRRRPQKAFDDLVARVIAVAVGVKAYDLHVGDGTTQIRVEIRPRPVTYGRT